MTRPRDRRGRGFVEVVVVMALVGVVTLVLLVSIPRGRETARRATCQRNLMQIGFALSLYQQAAGRLPTARLDGESPLAALLGGLGVADFAGLDARKPAPTTIGPTPPAERPVRGFVCPSDPAATAGMHRAPISYRATTGDTVDGRRGPFELGRGLAIPEVEAADGASFTAGFSERLVGPAPPVVGPAGYVVVAEPPPKMEEALAPRGDAGSSWLRSDWRSTLYNHSEPPGHSRSWIRADRLNANMGASSGHPGGVHVLMLDGSLKTVSPAVDASIWRALSTVGDRQR